MADAVCSAASTSPGSTDFQRWLERLAQTPARQSACNSTRTWMRFAAALLPAALLRVLRLRQDAEQVLHVVADLVRDHIGLGEFAGLAAAALEAHLHVAEERGVEIDAPVARAIERPHRRLRIAAAARLAAGVKPQPRRPVALAARLEDGRPHVLGVAEHGGDELAGLVGRRAGAPRGLLVRLLVGCRRC